MRIDPEASDFPAGVSVAIGSPGSLELLECRPFAFTIAVEAGEVYHFQAFDGDDPSSQGGNLSFVLEQVELQTTDGLDPLGQEYVQALAGDTVLHDGGFLFAVAGKDRAMVAGSNGVDADGLPPTADDAFHIGSISKVLTAVLTLTLVDEDVIDLDESAGTHVTRVDVPDAVTVCDLLQHTSGIYNYTEHRDFFDALFAEPGRVWSPEDAVEWAADQPPTLRALVRVQLFQHELHHLGNLDLRRSPASHTMTYCVNDSPIL